MARNEGRFTGGVKREVEFSLKLSLYHAKYPVKYHMKIN